jgi:AcrR family transcriptional regulator
MDKSVSPETGRPLRADARRNKKILLAVAGEALASDGSSVSFDEIARRAGVGVGTVYRHFPTKKALFEAVVVGRVEEFVNEVAALADSALPGEAFLEFFARIVDQASLNQALCDALEAGSGDHFSAPAELELGFLRVLAALLAGTQRAGAIRNDLDVADVRDLLIGCVTTDHRARDRGRADGLVAIVCAGMRVPSKRTDRV